MLTTSIFLLYIRGFWAYSCSESVSLVNVPLGSYGDGESRVTLNSGKEPHMIVFHRSSNLSPVGCHGSTQDVSDPWAFPRFFEENHFASFISQLLLRKEKACHRCQEGKTEVANAESNDGFLEQKWKESMKSGSRPWSRPRVVGKKKHPKEPAGSELQTTLLHMGIRTEMTSSCGSLSNVPPQSSFHWQNNTRPAAKRK